MTDSDSLIVWVFITTSMTFVMNLILVLMNIEKD